MGKHPEASPMSFIFYRNNGMFFNFKSCSYEKLKIADIPLSCWQYHRQANTIQNRKPR